ncbi:MAG TPA: hypothetical protein VD866_28240 [Urbifossiella sp.]|nr:hypothetical protein [Urbifossiella sp.]
MATQFITQEEAARRLGIPLEEFKRRLKTEWTHVTPMRDGPNLRFRENQIEELSRQLGAASDPELPLAAMELSDPGSDDFKLAPGPKTGKIPKAGKPADEPLAFDGSDDDIFSLSAEPVKPKKPTDESTDSDVRLEAPKSKPKGGGPNVPTEEISLDLGGGPGSAVIKGGSSAKLSAPKSSTKLSSGDSGKKLSSDSGKNVGKNKNLGDSSEFELSLDADSDDFEMQMSGDSSDEVDLGSSPLDEGGRAGKSGVNLRNPDDGGIPLDRKSGSGRNLGKAPPPVDDSDDFELSLEADSSEAEPLSAKAKPSSRSAPKIPVTSDSDSEFELTLDDSGDAGSLGSLEAAALDDEGKGDIFETDFEIPNMPDESGSEAVALESDTDLEGASEDVALDGVDLEIDEEDTSGSEAVVLDDEDEAPAPRSGRGRRGADDEWAGVGGGRRRQDDDEDDVPVGVAAPAPWGVIPAIVLFPSFALLLVGGLMAYELLHTMTGYAQPRKPASPIVRSIAKQLDMDVRDQ